MSDRNPYDVSVARKGAPSNLNAHVGTSRLLARIAELDSAYAKLLEAYILEHNRAQKTAVETVLEIIASGQHLSLNEIEALIRREFGL